MPKTRTIAQTASPLMADVDQLFDAGSDPSAKSRLISGGSTRFAAQAALSGKPFHYDCIS